MKIDQYFHLYGRKNDVVFEEVKWIPVTEALPEEKNMVLVTTFDDDIKTSYLTDKNYWWNIGRGKVTAWMPLPEPWKGNDESDR